jgi:hypothetical protein
LLLFQGYTPSAVKPQSIASIDGILDKLSAKLRLEETKQSLAREVSAVAAAVYRHPDHLCAYLGVAPLTFEFFIPCLWYPLGCFLHFRTDCWFVEAVPKVRQMEAIISLLQQLVEQSDALLASFQRPVVEESIPIEPCFQTCASCPVPACFP